MALAHRTDPDHRRHLGLLAARHPDHPHLVPDRPRRLLATASGHPESRRYLARHAWCLVSRHRLQRVCYEARLHTRAGRLPAICWIRPTKVGERAWILCRAGICADDFDAYKQEIAAACYAREARVIRNKKWSQLVTLDIVRHDPLGTSTSSRR